MSKAKTKQVSILFLHFPSCFGLALRVFSFPSEVEWFVVTHDLAVVNRTIELLTVDEERDVVGLEGREHAGNIRNLDICHAKFNLEFRILLNTFFTQLVISHCFLPIPLARLLLISMTKIKRSQQF